MISNLKGIEHESNHIWIHRFFWKHPIRSVLCWIWHKTVTSDDSNNLLSETTSEALSFENSYGSNSVLSDNPSDHYSSDGLSLEKTVPVKENGSCDDGSSDENTVATGTSGSVPSDHSFLEDNKTFIRNKEALSNKLNGRIDTYESFFDTYFGRMLQSVKALKSFNDFASSLLDNWSVQWEEYKDNYCAQV